MNELNELLALELFLGFLFFILSGVVVFFVCRLLLALSKFFEVKRRILAHDLALKNYRDDD